MIDYRLCLSTPHGTLGTTVNTSNSLLTMRTFNSTRYIRNSQKAFIEASERLLSTPHGTLGTVPENHNVRRKLDSLSTPHGTLGTYVFDIVDQDTILNFQLHTVH